MLPPLAQIGPNRVGTLRVRGGKDGTGARLALAAALDRVDLRPPGLPPASVLIVREMGDPLPGRVAPRPLTGGPDPAWERAARERLADFYRRAARPARGAVPADADAVLFADEGELLASLALDLATGRVGGRWWWRSFGGALRAGSRSNIAVLLRERAAWVPAALAELARQDGAADIVGRLSAEEALAVLTAVAQAHGIGPLASALTDATRSAPATRPEDTSEASWRESEARRESADITDTRAAVSASAVRPDPPWSSWLPPRAIARDLDRAQAALLGVALVLHHRPEAVRCATFAFQFRRWWRNEAPASAWQTPPGAPPRRTAQPPRPPTEAHSRPRLTAETGGTAAAPDAIAAAQAPAPRAILPASTKAPPATPTGRAETGAPDNPPPVLPARPRASIGFAAGHREAQSAPAPHTAAVDPNATGNPSIDRPSGDAPPRVEGADVAVGGDTSALAPNLTPSEWRLALENGVETRLGGVLFLINAMCALDLPQCCESGWRLASKVGAWGVLEGLGRTLLERDAAHDDPLWPALAALSGRGRDEILGAGVPRRAAYRLPLAWAEQLPPAASEAAGWAAHGRRLRLWSRGDFMLCEVPLGGLPAATVVPREAQFFGALARPRRRRFSDAPVEPALPDVAAGFARWLSLALPFLRLRLERALGLGSGSETLRDALLARPGRLYVTATHVDLVMGLDSVSLPVRLAGLDRSPGWLGEFGRVILFHFE